MKLQIRGFKDPLGGEGIQISATKKNDDVVNPETTFNVAMNWIDNPIMMGEMLNACLQELLYKMKTPTTLDEIIAENSQPKELENA